MADGNRVARHYASGDIRLEVEDIPTPGPGELLVRMRACGVCSGEAMAWYIDSKCPVVLGHEAIGEVADMGTGVTGFVTGERIFPHHHTPCGTCEDCRRGVETACAQYRATQLNPGGYCDYFTVPAESVVADTVKLPDSMSDEAAAMIEPLACCTHVFRKWPPRDGDAVVIIGLGAMGLFNALAADAMTTGPVIGLERIEQRREFARTVVPSMDVLEEKDDIRAAVRERTNGLGAGMVIVCPPSTEAIAAGSELLATGGRLIIYTSPAPGKSLALDWFDLWHREAEIAFSYAAAPQDTRQAMKLIEEGLPVESLITHRVGLDGVGEAIRRISDQEPGCIKNLVVPDLTA